MPIDWLYGLLGGLMIGGSAALFLLINGRVLGASGILGSVVDGSGPSGEKLAFLAGLVGFPAIVFLFNAELSTNATTNLTLLIAGGLATGIGTRLANGCTSGHGVCGISRFSLRGIAASAVYVGVGMITMVVFRTLLGWV